MRKYGGGIYDFSSLLFLLCYFLFNQVELKLCLENTRKEGSRNLVDSSLVNDKEVHRKKSMLHITREGRINVMAVVLSPFTSMDLTRNCGPSSTGMVI